MSTVARTACRHPADDSRRGRADAAGRSARAIAAAAAERRAARRRATSYFEAMGAMLNRGWAPLTGVLADRDKFIDLPIAERYDLAADRGGADQSVGPRRRSAIARSPRRCAVQRRAAGRAAGRRSGCCGAAARARLCVGQRAVQGALHRGGRSEAARRPGSGGSRRVEAFGARRFDEAVNIYRGRDRAPARHGDRVSASGVRRVAARQPDGAVAACNARRRRRRRSRPCRAAGRLPRRHRTRRRVDRLLEPLGARRRRRRRDAERARHRLHPRRPSRRTPRGRSSGCSPSIPAAASRSRISA